MAVQPPPNAQRTSGNVTKAAPSAGLGDKLKSKALAPAGTDKPQETVYTWIQKMEGEIARALPRHIDVTRFSRIVLTVVRQNPKLLLCTKESMMAAIMTAAQLGLEPGPLGLVWFIPYQVTKKDPNGQVTGKEYVCQFQVGYQGWLDLLYRTDAVSNVSCHEVFQGDDFSYEYGDAEYIKHIPSPEADHKKENITHVYLVVKFKDGSIARLVMTRNDVEAIRRRSKAANDGPWITDYGAMAKKTVIKQGVKYLPKRTEALAMASTSDETVKTAIADDMSLVQPIDTDYEVLADDDEPQEGTQEGASSEQTAAEQPEPAKEG